MTKPVKVASSGRHRQQDSGAKSRRHVEGRATRSAKASAKAPPAAPSTEAVTNDIMAVVQIVMGTTVPVDQPLMEVCIVHLGGGCLCYGQDRGIERAKRAERGEGGGRGRGSWLVNLPVLLCYSFIMWPCGKIHYLWVIWMFL